MGDWQIPISSTRNKVRYRKENGYVNMVITIDGEQKEHDSQDKHKGESSTWGEGGKFRLESTEFPGSD